MMSELMLLDSKAEEGALSIVESEVRIKVKGELFDLYLKEERNMLQKCKLQWLNEGNENTRFFHRYLAARKRKNLISEFTSLSGIPLVSSVEIKAEFQSFYSSLYQRITGSRQIPSNLS